MSPGNYSYEGQVVDIKNIGRELGVRYVLEGSVHKSGTHVRITAQQIDGLTGAHLWADRFAGPWKTCSSCKAKSPSVSLGLSSRRYKLPRFASPPRGR